jgi:branched-subunit amino acid ABC-type transport system permease component
MADFLQTLINAIAMGSLFALIALGYTMVYGVLKLINFAHSDIVVLGAWISVTLGVVLLPALGISGTGHWWAAAAVLVLSMGICGLIGYLIERLAYRPIRKAPRLNALITAIGVSLFLQNFGQLRFQILGNERVVASGDVIERPAGVDAKTIRLAVPVTVEADANYVVRVFKKSQQGGSGTTRTVAAPPGTYPPGTDVALESGIGRSETRDARFELLRVANRPPLYLPFGAMPASVPKLFADRTLGYLTYIRQIQRTTVTNPDGTWTSEERYHDLLADRGWGARPAETPQVPYPADWKPSNETAPDGTMRRVDLDSFEKPVEFRLFDVIIVGTAVVLMILLQLLVYRTTVGTAMRAVSFNMETSGLMGIPVDRIVSFTFVTGTALAAAAGFLYAMRYQQVQQPAHSTWVLLGLKAFVAAVVGGIGNIRGATVGGYLIAFIEQFGVYFGQQLGWDNASAYTDVYVFVLLIVVLLVKPTGIFGSTVREKV